MIIEGEFYKITPANESSNFFDLELLYDIKGKNARKEFKVVGYGMPMTRVLQHIIRHAVNNKFGEEEIVSLKQYLEEYKQQYESIKREITNLGL